MVFDPPDEQSLHFEYYQRRDAYTTLRTTVKEILNNKITENGIKIIPLESRTKEFDSFYEKIIRKEFSNDYFNRIEDIAGVRVPCIYFSDLEKIGDIVSQNFDIVSEKKLNFEERVDPTGYQSDHYIVKLRKDDIPKLDEYFHKDIGTLNCEIQVRTALMHAWALVSRNLIYKKEIPIGKDYEREMYALSSLFFFADQRFDSYMKIRKKLDEKITKIFKPFDLKQKIDPASLASYLTHIFPDRSESTKLSQIELVKELSDLNYTTFEQLDPIFKKTEKILLQYEKENPIGASFGTARDSAGALRICIAIGDLQNKDSNSFYIKEISKYRKMLGD